MVVKKKKTRLLRAGAVETPSPETDENSVSDTTEAQEPEAPTPQVVGVGGRENRIRAKKAIKKKTNSTPKAVVGSSNSGYTESSDLDLLETDTSIINARQFLSRVLDTDEFSLNRYWMNKKKLLVATVDCQSDTIIKVEIEPTEYGQELAEILWDEIEGEGLDPHTVDVSQDGWHFQYATIDGEDE